MRIIAWPLIAFGSATAAFPVVALAQESNLPTPPSGCDQRQSGVPEGTVETTTYPAGSYGTHIIMDNLIADGLAVPMIMVMPNNGLNGPNDMGGHNQYETIVVSYLISSQECRVIAGLSLGGGITFKGGEK